MDWSFILTLAIILLATLVGSYLRSSRKDRCLCDFDGFHVTVEKKNGRVVWGEMDLAPTGFELIVAEPPGKDRKVKIDWILIR